MVSSKEIAQRLNESVNHLRKHLRGPVQTALIGRPGIEIDPAGFTLSWQSHYADIPNYPVRGDSGATGSISEFRNQDSGVLVFSRRPHLYEGYAEWELGYPVHLAAALGVRNLLTFSAAGGLKGTYYPGLLVLIEDFINFAQVSPLRGFPGQSGASLFASMRQILEPELTRLAQQAAEETRERLAWGTYVMVRGPQFETLAELKMLASLGAELIGMSTVPELICARAYGLRTLPLALITNLPLQAPVTDEEVNAEVARAAQRIRSLLNRIIELAQGGADVA